jgi:hypothetical protein
MTRWSHDEVREIFKRAEDAERLLLTLIEAHNIPLTPDLVAKLTAQTKYSGWFRDAVIEVIAKAQKA